jgi:outer membrane receptor for ferrienterochelin and colicin
MKKFTLFCAAAAVVAPAAAYAQETTSVIRGEVTAGGAPVAGAEVVVTHVPSGTTSRSTTGSDGAFSAAGLRVGGPYTVTVTAPGQEGASVTDIFLTAGEPFRVPVELAAPGQEIVVTGTRTAREQSTGPITTLTREDIEGVASVARDIRDIARRDPFVTMDPTNSRTIEIAGTNGRLNRFSVDGVQMSDDFGLNNGGLPTSRGPVPFDAIEQLSVKVAPYDIAEGDFQGGAINVVLRSGTNRFSGSAFGSYTDDKLTGSRTRGQDVNLEFDSKNYGGLLAGPIVPGRLFFMVAYEKLKEKDPFDEGIGPGFATQVPGITLAQIDQVSAIAQNVYGYDTLGIIQNAVEEDEKVAVKLDLNVTDDHRASFTYVRNVGTQQFQQNTFVTGVTAIGLRSNGYELAEEVNSGVFQINSTWSDVISTEMRASYRDTNRDQTPFGGRQFSQFEVCLDPTSINSGSNNNLTNCGSSRIFFGPDISRQANDLNTENLSFEFTGRAALGAHTLRMLAGYTDISTRNLFLQNALGNVYFDSLADFQARRASRVRLGGAVPSLDPNDAAADFTTQNYTFGFQDDWDVSDTLQLSLGVRYDLFNNPERPPLNPNFLARHGFANTATFNGRGAWQPRFGFNWNPADRLIIRGGVGIFAGGTPDVFVSNSFSNTGQLTNQIDIQRTTTPAGCTPIPTGLTLAQQQAFCNGALTGVTGTGFPSSVTGFLTTNVASLAAAPVNAIDPDLDISRQMRASLSVNYDLAGFGSFGEGWLVGADILYGQVIDAYQWTDIRSVPIGTLPDGRQRYGPKGGTATNNQDLLMTNEQRGRSIIGVARISKEWDFGLGLDASYTRSDVKDTNAMTSATAGSLYSNNAFADPNFAAYGRSIYEIKDQWKFAIDYKRNFFGENATRFSLFGEYRSGRPYSLTMIDRGSGRLPVFGTVGNGARHLLYVPTGPNDPLVSYGAFTQGGVTQTAAEVQSMLDQFISANGLEKYRGKILPKNTQMSPDVFKIDIRVSQDIPTFGFGKIKLFADLENALNLIDSDWGALRQVSFPQTAALVTVECAVTAGNNCTQYRYSRFTDPNLTLSARQSLYSVRLGARFEF